MGIQGFLLTLGLLTNETHGSEAGMIHSGSRFQMWKKYKAQDLYNSP